MKTTHHIPLQVYPARGTGTPVIWYTDTPAPELPAKVGAANGNLCQGAKDQKQSTVPRKALLCAQREVSPQLPEPVELVECCCRRRLTHPSCTRSSSHQHHWVLADLSKSIFVATPQLSVPRQGRIAPLKRSSALAGGNLGQSNIHGPSASQLPLISASVIRPRHQAVIGKRRPDKKIGVTRARGSQGLLNPKLHPGFFALFCLKTLNRRFRLT